MTEFDLSFVIVNWNTRDLLCQCIQAIHRTVVDQRYEIILVDNASSDGSVEAVRRQFPEVRCIVNRENRGFGAANNQAFAVMQGRYAVLINTDAELLEGAAKKLHTFMETHSEVGMACGQLLNTDGSRQNSHATFPTLLPLLVNESALKMLFPKRYPSKYQTYVQPLAVDSCIGACMIVRKTAMEQVGVFDERYFFFFEETDWARQFREHGWEIYFVPDAQIIHAQGQSAGENVLSRKLFYYSRYQYLRKWHSRLYPLMKSLIVLRLFFNALLNSVAVVLTAGMLSDMRMRCRRYLQLLAWHIAGCPFPIHQ